MHNYRVFRVLQSLFFLLIPSVMGMCSFIDSGLGLGRLPIVACNNLTSACGSVGKAVVSDSRGPRFESSDQQK